MQQLREGAAALGLNLSPEQVEAFRVYSDQLVDWNSRFNLTSIRDEEGIQTRHFLDSLSCMLSQPVREVLERGGARLIDVGSGAGFPGIPLKLIFPTLNLTLIEATGKKVAFLDHIVQRLGLQPVKAIHARAEELGHEPAHRQQYDLAVARAVAHLGAVLEYTLPFCAVGGWAVAYKGEAGPAEAQAARKAMATLGGELHSVLPVELPGLPQDRWLVVVQKVRPTPRAYPRRPGVPASKPLG
jgi:16S rRNA (guanine527-N7)-methyltransferase